MSRCYFVQGFKNGGKMNSCCSLFHHFLRKRIYEKELLRSLGGEGEGFGVVGLDGFHVLHPFEGAFVGAVELAHGALELFH